MCLNRCLYRRPTCERRVSRSQPRRGSAVPRSSDYLWLCTQPCLAPHCSVSPHISHCSASCSSVHHLVPARTIRARFYYLYFIFLRERFAFRISTFGETTHLSTSSSSRRWLQRLGDVHARDKVEEKQLTPQRLPGLRITIRTAWRFRLST